jgi:hypothetical protein
MSDGVDAVECEPERFAAKFFSSRRRAYLSMMMFVIVALVGLFQLPPSLSVYCATAGEQMNNNSKIKNQQRKRLKIFPFTLSLLFGQFRLWCRPGPIREGLKPLTM